MDWEEVGYWEGWDTFDRLVGIGGVLEDVGIWVDGRRAGELCCDAQGSCVMICPTSILSLSFKLVDQVISSHNIC